MQKRYSIVVVFLLFILSIPVKATHLRAADIFADRIGEMTYQITIFVYSDVATTSIADGGAGNIPVSPASVLVGGESFEVPRTSFVPIGNNTLMHVFTFEHTFPAVNAGFTIAYNGLTRNAGIVNIGTPSDASSLYVETFVFIDAFSQINSTPILFNPPIDVGAVGEVYTHNPGAFDADGDSLSFQLLTPQESLPFTNTNATPTDVPGYRFLDDPTLGGATFSLDPLTGDIVWDAPSQPGEYNIAFMVEEFRNGVRIGFVVRDMQIIISETDNNRPLLELPPDTCLAAGLTLFDSVLAWDPDGDMIDLELIGGTPNLGAGFMLAPIEVDSVRGIYTWPLECEDIREQPYLATFRVEDVASVPLSNTETWQITVLGPAPTNFNATALNVDSIALTWDPYLCAQEASRIVVWRRECDSGMVVRDPCLGGLPEEGGYTRIAEVASTETTYIDTQIATGIRYYYVLTTEYDFPRGGASFATPAIGVNTIFETPVITEIDVIETSLTIGQVRVEWLPPLDLDTLQFLPPYQYQVFRSEGFNTTNFGAVPVFTAIENSFTPVSFIDTGLNTEELAYTYQVVFSSGTSFTSTSETATTVNASLEVEPTGVILSWDFASVWQNVDTVYDRIFQVLPTDTVLVDSVISTQQFFNLGDLEIGQEFCYLVEKQYVFCHDSIEGVFTSNSNVTCIIPQDTFPPCPPVLSLDPIDCALFTDTTTLQNSLKWQNVLIEGCDTNAVSYRIHFAENQTAPFTLLDSTIAPVTSFIDGNLTTLVGCYAVTAVDESGNESVFSNIVCADNCILFELPNIFTPNGSGVNDFFVPIQQSQFIRSASLVIYNRWGKEVFKDENITALSWDGRDVNGGEVSDGVYYYEAVVEFDVLDTEADPQVFRGWVQVIR